MSRPARAALIGLGVLGFLIVSGLLARYLTTENVERDAIFALLRAQVRGDSAAMLAQLSGCSTAPSCRSTVLSDARQLRRPGQVKILSTDSKTAYALTTKQGLTRVAWKVPSALPVVQCVTVRRKGNAISGLSVTLLALGPPINGTVDC